MFQKPCCHNTPHILTEETDRLQVQQERKCHQHTNYILRNLIVFVLLEFQLKITLLLLHTYEVKVNYFSL